MTVKTTFSKEDFAKILSNYNLGNYKKSQTFKLGAIQTNLLLETTKGKFAFRYYETRPERYALFEVYLLEHLAGKRYPSPAPIRNKNGNLLGKYKQKPFAIFTFMHGRHKKSVDPILIAKAVGKLHEITAGYKPDYCAARDTYDQKSCWRNAILNSRKIKSKPEAKQRLEWLKSELRKLQLPVDLPKGVCHCDTHPSNFLYINGKLVAVLDFDDASYVYLLYDIANMIYFWAWPDKAIIKFDKAKKLLEEYSKYRKLTSPEKEYLYDMLKMVIFMSIGWFIHANDYNNEQRKIEYLNSISRKDFYNRIFT